MTRVRSTPRPHVRGRVRAALAAVLVALCALPGLTACGARIQKSPTTRVVQANTERDFWSALVKSVRAEEYLIGATGVDERERTLVSAWKTDTAPFRGGPNSISRRSFKTRVRAEYQPLPLGEVGALPDEELPRGGVTADLEAFRVTVRVEREVNDSLRPMDLRSAKWVAADDDAEAARRIVFDLALRLGGDTFELHDDPERKRVLDSVRER